MEEERRQQQSAALSQCRQGQNLKLEDSASDDEKQDPSICFHQSEQAGVVGAQVDVLDCTFSCCEPDRAAAKRATHILSELAKSEEVVNVIIDGGAVPVLVRHLRRSRGTAW